MNANGERTVEQIVQVLQSKYDVSLSVLKKDIVHALRDLQWKRLIKLREIKKWQVNNVFKVRKFDKAMFIAYKEL